MTISATSPTTAGTAGSLTMQDFLKVLLTQLTYQDPLKPMDNQQFMAQIAQFTSLQQTQEMNANIAQLLTNQAALQSVGLIGRTVDFVTSTGTQDSGTVTALSLSSGAPQLSITSRTTGQLVVPPINLSQIVAVR